MPQYVDHNAPSGQPCDSPAIQSTLRGGIGADRFKGNRHSCYTCGREFTPAEMRERFPEPPDARDVRRHAEWLAFIGMTQDEYDRYLDFPENHYEIPIIVWAPADTSFFLAIKARERAMIEAMGLPMIVMKSRESSSWPK
jgi:hypothetical protein